MNAANDSTARPEEAGPAGRGDLVAALTKMTQLANGEFTVDEMLTHLCRVVISALGVSGAGVMVTQHDVVRFVHAEPELVTSVERLQEVLQAGPCLAAIIGREAVVVDDIGADHRWPEFSEATNVAGIKGVVAVPLLARETVFGALDLYDDEARAWSPTDLAMAQLFADVAASYVIMADDRNRLRAKQRVFEQLATHDGLTGLPNRALLVDRLEHAVAGTARHRNELAVFFIDLDRFKEINDTLGHAAGDLVLLQVTGRLSRVLRGTDTLARYAGDEFVIICEDFTDSATDIAAEVAAIADRINVALSEPAIMFQGSDLLVTVSIGAALTNSGTTVEDLLADADNAMYVAKQRGPGHFVLHDRSTGPAVVPRQSLERDLRTALEHHEFRTFYQPIVSTGRGRPVVAVEALLRWVHPRRGLLVAAAFIDIAERTRLIDEIGAWVIDQAAGQLRTWHDQSSPSRLEVFVNLSPRELANPKLDRVVADALDRHGIAPEELGFEIVEGFMTEPLLVGRAETYRERRHPLAIDDFGTGFSSLSRLVDLPVGHAKIDHTVTARVTVDERRLKLVESIVVVAHRLGMAVTAEGVETAAQADLLTEAGCDRLQGYLFGRPQPGNQLAATWAAAPTPA